MNTLLNTLILVISLGLKAHSFHGQATLTWTPCFDALNCSKLEVPLDYSNRNMGMTSIAFMKLAGKNATAESPSIVLIPGGPGGSGVELLLTYQNVIGQMLGEQYNFVSFDPRSVNNSGLHLDCFSGDAEARSAFYRLHKTDATNISSPSALEEQYDSSSIYGQRCNNAVENQSPHSYYVTTPAVAHDLLTFTEAEAELAGQPSSKAKLWCYSVSYGTVIGSTFASLFPDRVGRMILDGVMNAEQYYDNYRTDEMDHMDKAMETFSTFCHAAGPDKCSFWGPTPAKITTRMDGIIRQLQNHPVTLSGAEDRTVVTCSDLKTLFLNTLYAPLAKFPSMADILHQAERGNVSALAGMYDLSNFITDARLAITCTDSYRRNRLTTLEEFKTWAEYTTSKSKYIGDIYPIFLETILCRSFRPQLPDSMVIQDEKNALKAPTSFPILFASNTIDPITPLKSYVSDNSHQHLVFYQLTLPCRARKMSSRFPGSVILMQEAVGHTVINQGASTCYFEHIQAYLQGIVPSSNTTCPRQYTPFIDELPL
ncbi:hypothetical protein N7492_004324 [Penicillium capsulatum]|uniref:Peptidase S33 tripeptidyl aminopeptidase-like C-terminal domain-containing protein n=1 Tax=Penicillium capsulatum TaxID=69766 RepID=A0A9W9LQM3_9EURO|nr:hypothetical protein N7492_004324 [Penicillium capsulatum]